uniref:Disease resistance N-terminal domain-containing protein n=1 Tax=Oryza barthii TaxID=65489 RepID=A0A0D3HM19_9ORYZ
MRLLARCLSKKLVRNATPSEVPPIDNLSSLLPAAAAAGSSRGLDALEELRTLERTMRRIHATLRDAEQRWNIREESAAKLRLEELKELAYDAEDVVEEYEYEVNRRKVEALDRLAAVRGGGGKRKREEICLNPEQTLRVS